MLNFTGDDVPRLQVCAEQHLFDRKCCCVWGGGGSSEELVVQPETMRYHIKESIEVTL